MDEVRYQQDGKGLGETYFYITPDHTVGIKIGR